MKCTDARPLLDPLCDGALEPKDSALVLDHLKTCDECHSEWQGLEELHVNFQQAKAVTQIPRGLMDKVSNRLREEETSQWQRAFGSPKRVFVIAACFIAVGLLVIICMHRTEQSRHPVQAQLASASAAASAETLIEAVLNEASATPVADRTELADDVGFDIKYVRLPEWRMDRSSVYKSQENAHIARFDFVRISRSGAQRMTCYQAPEGSIRANGATLHAIRGKHVLIGHHGEFQYALWSQNGRDYLFVTMLPLSDLEAIVGGA